MAPERYRARRDFVDPAAIEGARRRAMPRWVEPELATRVRAAPDGDAWLHEIKLDGYRILARIEKRRARLLTRKGLDWTDRFAPIAEALARLPAERALVDGEVVVVEADGTTRFQALQEAISEGRGDRLSFYGFDLLHLDGWDLTRAALEARKGALAPLLARLPEGPIRYSDHVAGNGPDFFADACTHAVEGIVSKLRDRPYRSGRGRDWVKVKCAHRQEFVIGGWTEPSGSREGLGALLLGVRDRAAGPLRYAGKVGTGFTAQTLQDLVRRLAPLEHPRSPFADPVPRAHARGAHWVEPRLVAEIEFAEWTRDSRLRHPSFQGLREDLPAREVTREVAVSTPEGEAGPRGRDEVLGVRLSNPDRVLWPEQGITKCELARYIETVADRMLPHVTERPLTLIRCPRGREKECFYQKHADDAFPPSIRRVMVKEERGKSAPYVAVDDAAGLVTLVQFGVLEIHPWGSRADDLERPDHLIFDLDPDAAVPWKRVVEAARALRGRLEGLGLATFVKTTGGKGLHVEVPLIAEHGWEPAKTFAGAVATGMARDEPERYVATASKAGRRGKIYVDWLRNARGATAVAPYSPRARSGAPVATPLRWEELGRVEHPGAYRIENLRRRLASLSADPWERYDEARASLTPAIEALVGSSPRKRRRPRVGSASGT